MEEMPLKVLEDLSGTQQKGFEGILLTVPGTLKHGPNTLNLKHKKNLLKQVENQEV